MNYPTAIAPTQIISEFPINSFLESIVVDRDNTLFISIERQKLMNANIKEVHDFKIGAVLVDGDYLRYAFRRSMVEMHIDATTIDGFRLKIEEVGVQTWQDGKIIAERYFYDPVHFEGKAKEYNQIH
jgi:hypothetical protein